MLDSDAQPRGHGQANRSPPHDLNFTVAGSVDTPELLYIYVCACELMGSETLNGPDCAQIRLRAARFLCICCDIALHGLCSSTD